LPRRVHPLRRHDLHRQPDHLRSPGLSFNLRGPFLTTGPQGRNLSPRGNVHPFVHFQG
jgi:hypothetical protein